VESDPLITSDEVILLLQVNRRTLYRLIQQRAFPARRVGRHWRFRKSEVLHWLRRNDDRPREAALIRRRVLLVDDDESVRGWMKEVLTSYAYDVDGVPDGRQGLRRLDAAHYDLAIIDLRMPGLDGLSVIRHLRAHSATLPVIVVTGHSTEASAVEALNLGVSFYLTKPFRLPQLLKAVNYALQRPA
jgi:excisionase family DNA binding protein